MEKHLTELMLLQFYLCKTWKKIPMKFEVKRNRSKTEVEEKNPKLLPILFSISLQVKGRLEEKGQCRQKIKNDQKR